MQPPQHLLKQLLHYVRTALLTHAVTEVPSPIMDSLQAAVPGAATEAAQHMDAPAGSPVHSPSAQPDLPYAAAVPDVDRDVVMGSPCP